MSRPHQTLIQGVAWFDLLLTFPLALPGLADWWLPQLLMLFGKIDISPETLGLNAITLMMTNIMGLLAVMWAWVRIRHPENLLGRTDAVARLVIGSLILYFVLMRDVPIMLWAFVLTEYLGAVLQFRLFRNQALVAD